MKIAQKSLQFGPFTLDLQRLCLRGPEGEVELRPKSFDIRLDPYYPTSVIGWLGVAYCMLRRLGEALELLRAAVTRSPKRAMFHYWLAAVYGHLGEAEAAREEAARLLALQPDFTITTTARPLAVFRIAAHADYFLDGLRRSGLPM